MEGLSIKKPGSTSAQSAAEAKEENYAPPPVRQRRKSVTWRNAQGQPLTNVKEIPKNKSGGRRKITRKRRNMRRHK